MRSPQESSVGPSRPGRYTKRCTSIRRHIDVFMQNATHVFQRLLEAKRAAPTGDGTISLIDAGATVYAAAQGGDHVALSRLLQLRADANARKAPKVEGIDGETSLVAASREGHANVVRLLIAYGASVNTESHGATPLLAAAANCRPAVVRVLLDEGSATLEFADRRGATPLIAACSTAGSPRHLEQSESGAAAECVRLLIDATCNVNAAQHDGVTPLIATCYRGHTEIAMLLCAAGAAVEPVWQGNSAERWAKRHGHEVSGRLDPYPQRPTRCPCVCLGLTIPEQPSSPPNPRPFSCAVLPVDGAKCGTTPCGYFIAALTRGLHGCERSAGG